MNAPTNPAAVAGIERLLTALRFYARGEHYHLDESEEFDTVSGEPQNWLCSGREGSATMVENGRVALLALQGTDGNWRDGDDDLTPAPVNDEDVAFLRLHRVLLEVAQERERQDLKWGGPSHDDHHDTSDFVQLIQDYAGWARTMAGMGSVEKTRRRLVQVAALAVAAVESLDRRAIP